MTRKDRSITEPLVVSHIHPNLVNYDSTHTPTIISDFKIFHKSFDELPNKKKKQLSGKTHPLYSKNITLTSSDNNIGIKFAALSYVHPEKKKYAYKLEGFDKDWIYTDATSRQHSTPTYLQVNIVFWSRH